MSIRRLSIVLLALTAIFFAACGRHQLRPDELLRNQLFAEILERQDRRHLGDDDFFPQNLLHNPHPEVRRWCALALGRIGNRRALPWLYESLRTGDASVRSASAFALGEIEDRELLREQFLQPRPQSLIELSQALKDASVTVRMRAIEALGKIGEKANAPVIAGAVKGIQFRSRPERDAFWDLFFVAQKRLLFPADQALMEAYAGGTPQTEMITPKPASGMEAPWAPIIQAYRRIAAGDDARAKTALLKQMDPYLAEAEVQSALLGALHDIDRNVRLAAAGLLRKSGNQDIGEDPGPLRPTASSLTYQMVAALRRERTLAIMETTRGMVEIELFREDAPMTVSNFIALARQGFYNGTAFTQIVPSARIRGGDYPDGREKHPGHSIRCEINMRPFERGSLGMALEGKDFGAGRFFITLAPQPLLDGACTCFGRVVSGMPAVERMVPGDRILRIEVRDEVTWLDYRRY